MRRALFWILLILVALVAAAAVTIEVVLRSDLPRQRVMQALSAALGMDVRIGELRPRWNGRTELTDLKLTLALEDRPMAVVPAVEVRHTSILRMIVTRSVDLQSLQIRGGELYLRQNVAGQWNIQQVLANLRHAEPQSAARSLPELDVEGLTVHVIRPGAALEAGNLQFRGEPVGDVAWQFSGTLGTEVAMHGQLATRDAARRHELVLEGRDLRRLAALWWPQAPAPLAAEVRWQGRLEDAALRGRLHIVQARAGSYAAYGPLDLTLARRQVSLQPARVVVTAETGPVPQVTLLTGQAHMHGQTFTADQLVVECMGALGRVDGTFNQATGDGRIEAAWSGGLDAPRITHEGQVKLAITRPTPSRYETSAQIQTTGRTPWGRWEAQLNAQALGQGVGELRWRLVIPQLAWTDLEDQQFLVKDITADLSVHDRRARLADLRVAGDHQLQAAGELDLDDRTWRLAIDGRRIVPPGASVGPIALMLEASGGPRHAAVEKLEAQLADLSLSGVGSYDAERTVPLEGLVKIDYAVSLAGDEGEPPSPRWRGRLSWEGTVRGRLEPRDIRAAGRLEARQLIVNRHALHDVSAPLVAHAQGDVVEVESEGFELLAGRTSLRGRYTVPQHVFDAQLRVNRIDLGEVVSFVNEQLTLEGLLDADIQARLTGWSLDELAASGSWSVRDFKSTRFSFDAMDGRLRTSKDILQLDPIALRLADGRAEGIVTFNLADARSLTAELALDRWPHRFEEHDLALKVDGQVNLRSDVADGWIRGDIEMMTDVEFRGRPGGRIAMTGRLSESMLSVQSVRGELLRGLVHGHAEIDLVAHEKSTGRLEWTDLEPAAAGDWWQYPRHVGGRLSGELVFGPADEPRPLEAMRYEATVRPQELMIAGAPIGDISMVGYLGADRFLIHNSSIHFADGRAEVWASATRHVDGWHMHGQVEFAELDLNELNRIVNPRNPRPMPGRVTGDIRLLGPVGREVWPTGRGRVSIAQSDLVNSNIVGYLLRVMGVAGDRTEPRGEGEMRVSLENKALRIYNFRYFNRGVEVLGSGALADLSLRRQTPIRVYLIGVHRPFRGWDIPFLTELDEVLKGLQASVTTVRVGGTLDEPEPHLVPLAAVTGTLRRLLLGEDEPEAE